MTADELIAFEAEIAERFNAGEIRAPVHLSGGNEQQLISYFADRFRPGDWVCSNWRSHYHALLAGVPPEAVHAAIMAGRSITLCFPEHRVISSAIVGGIVPIALGLAVGEKRAGTSARAHCFVGDMTERGGAYHEAAEYAFGHDLPLSFVIEDNGKSVGTPTMEVWGTGTGRDNHCEHHLYELPWPHAGSGRWIKF